MKPDKAGNWIVLKHSDDYAEMFAMRSQDDDAPFRPRVATGAKSNRDDVVLSYSKDSLAERVSGFLDAYNLEVDRFARKRSSQTIGDFLKGSSDFLQWSSGLISKLQQHRYGEFDASKIRECLYRPYTKVYLYYDELLNDRPGIFRNVFPNEEASTKNVAIYATSHSQQAFTAQVTNVVANEAFGGRPGICFPFYLYDADGTNRRENITNWALNQFRTHYKDKKISKWDIFHYVYGVLHHPGYREKFADNLKRELPRIPFAPDFRAFAKAGEKLAKLHLDYETLEPWKLKWMETPGVPLSYRVEKMKLSKDKTTLVVNRSLTLGDIPPETSEYRLGNRSALEWVIDQYQVSEDKRSGIKSDPNREDDEEYIVRLVGQVVRVSVETVKIVKGLPEAFA